MKYEIRDGKGEAVDTTMIEDQAIEKVKALKVATPKADFMVVQLVPVYDTSNPPVEIEF